MKWIELTDEFEEPVEDIYRVSDKRKCNECEKERRKKRFKKYYFITEQL